MKIALVSGTSISQSDLFNEWDPVTLKTPYGTVEAKTQKNLLLVNRHGVSGQTPPHAINYKANLKAVAEWGAESLLSLNSVGSLTPDLPPGTLLSCGDYVSFDPITFFDDQVLYQVPRLENNLLPDIEVVLREDLPKNKVYVQTKGPRFETPAEIRVVRTWGHVVGMTLAHEADLAGELRVPYTSLAMVDNYANGMGQDPLTAELFREQITKNQVRINKVLSLLIHYFEKS
ncbi:MAG: MTAP family purine nucleoside phosphorylase [Opitutales bacterium]|nr:MTAP family purine nucleoside phosphorylase [Opitutales bacterium]